MKYQYQDQLIPQDNRKELNEKILYLIDQDLAEKNGISHEDIYNAYTGDGGLHGLNRSDFNNYHEFSEAKKEIENGQFFTPPALCRFIVDALEPALDETVADLTFGMGSFCNFVPMEANFYGCELDIKSYKVARYLYPAANLEHGDIRSYNPNMRFDYIVGNPPFNLKWNVDGAEILSQMFYCQKAAQLLKPLGIMAVIVPASFLSDDFIDKLKISEMESEFSFLGQVFVQKDAFSTLGVNNYATKIMFWQKRLDENDKSGKYDLNTVNCFTLSDMRETEQLVDVVRTCVVLPAKERMKKDRIRAKMALAGQNEDPFMYQVRKMLYQIKSNPKLRDKYAKCQEYLYRFEHQVMPDGMKYDEWVKIRITEAKVLAYLRRTLASQNKKPYRDEIRLVKQDYGLVYKAYSPKMARKLTDTMKMPIPLYQIVAEMEDPDQFGAYASVIRRKQRDFQCEMRPFSEMEQDEAITEYLDKFTVYDFENEEQIYLNNTQKHDLNLIIQKRFHLLQWEQGSGKTLAGIAVGSYRMKHQGAFCTWVVSSAISIKNNWDPVLKNYALPYTMVSRLSDLNRIERGDFVLITLNMLSKYRKQIKKWNKIHGQNVCLVFDESDEITNPDSKRAKSVLDCFRRVKFKLEMTGTVTRNNISECAPQLELLYNNSYNMISKCETIYTYNKADSTLETEGNPYYMQPIPAYKPGYRLFSQSHLPEKITVFGVSQKTQDIFNSEELEDILSHTVITRTLDEIMGREIRRIHQVTVSFTDTEHEVYRQAIEEFYSMRNRYFASTGNSRKDSMMALVQQITLLLRICAAPNTVQEYDSGEVPTKIQKVVSMIRGWPDEIAVIGVRHKAVVNAYAEELRKQFPDRQIFVVTGSNYTLAKRRELRRTLQESGNGIMVCTQQCLPSSINMEFVNKVIIPESHFNNARMSQFYHRFIRFTSKDWKDIYFVTYAGSIESNQMQMVLAKEKLNLFMKGEDVDLDEIYQRFGVDYDLESLLMRREVDSDGRSFFRWGEQRIS